MTTGPSIDGVLVEWGERLFYPASRIVKPDATPRLNTPNRPSAAAIRQRIAATVVRRAPQVMVKVTGGGRGMGAIAAHFRYICKNGQLRIEDDRGVVREGKEAMHDLIDQWRVSGSLIPETSHRREAFNIMLSMPHGTDAQTVLKAARGFAKRELRDHHYVMVLHEHQANPHVHLSVKAESIDGKRLNPRKTDLHRWRETFAENTPGWLMRKVTEEGLNLIKRFEGFSPTIYICPAGYPTVGYGHGVLTHEQDQFAAGITPAQATELLRKDVRIAERAVLRLISVPLTDGQFDALVSFTFNLGAGALQRSTLRRKVNRGEQESVPAELMKWVWAAGKRMPGLIRRRRAEALAYSSGAPEH